MATVYQLMIGEKQIGDVYHNEDDAARSAMRIAIDSGGVVEVWEAEEIEGTPYDELEWSNILRVF